eukprot:XP_003726176.1 PREDICTED: beta-1,3-galactosyltransferase 5-like [Strongylocentrotus purpuratus]
MVKRMHLARAIGPFFLGAIFMYSIQIFYSYPSLENYFNSHVRALDVERYGYVGGYVDHAPREYGWKHNGRYKVKRHHADKVMKTVKREELKPSKFQLLIDEVNHLLAEDMITKNDESELVINPKLQHPTAETGEIIYNKDITIPRHKHYVDEPVDAHNYTYIHKPKVCSKVTGRRIKVFLIFIVTTSPKNLERRMLIRNTYGSKRRWPVLTAGVFRTVFLLGAVDNMTLQNDIHDESETYKDIVQEDFVDSYANLTLKTVMGLKWVTNYCRHARYTMKIDDDSMIHQNRLLQVLKNATAVKFTAAESLMDAPVIRNTSSKYYISETYYPLPTYPPYLNGPGYLLSTDLTEGIYNVAVKTQLFPWEDVFLGICLKQLGVLPKLYHDFIFIVDKESRIANKTRAVKLFKHFTVVSNLKPDDMMLMWTNTRTRITRDTRS